MLGKVAAWVFKSKEAGVAVEQGVGMANRERKKHNKEERADNAVSLDDVMNYYRKKADEIDGRNGD